MIALPAIPGLEIAPKKYSASSALAFNHLDMNFNTQRLKYPEVKRVGGTYEIRQPLGKLPHKIATDLFVTAMRVYADSRMAGKQLPATVTIYGKNLPVPLEKEILILFGE